MGHMVALFLFFKGNFILFSIVTVPIYISTSIVEGFPSLYILSSIYCLWILMMALLTGMRQYLIIVFIFICLLNSMVE